jgi:hypothetical protein
MRATRAREARRGATRARGEGRTWAACGRGEGRGGRWLSALAALVLGAACDRGARPEGAAGAGGASDAELLLPALGLAVRVPLGADVRGGRGGTVIKLEGGARTIAFGPPGEGGALSREGSRLRDLRGGGFLRYRPKGGVGGGGGGPEVELEGEIMMGGRAYSVRCRAQGEPLPPAEWCVPFLESLRAEGEPAEGR